MPRLPSVESYGQRPSLRSNRVDMPDQSGPMVADSLANAANVFTRMAGEKKAKDDRVNYALAKSEILQADIAEREKLRDDQDWATYDERYTTGFNTARDEIIGRYPGFSDSDRALLSADSDLTRERGRVNVLDSARKGEIDEKVTRLNDQLLKMRETIILADPLSANDQMLSALDLINAAKDEGLITDAEALKESQELAADLSIGRLKTMDPKLRQQELEKSLAHRKTGGPISVDDIRAEKGTGSIADFLPADMATKMLEETKNQNEIDNEMEIAMAARDAAADMYPVDNAAMMKHIRESTKGQPAKIRARAEQMGRQLASERDGITAQERTNTMVSATALLNERDENGNPVYGIEDLPSEELSTLLPTQVAQLEQVAEGQQFARITNWHDEVREGGKKDGEVIKPSYMTWSNMSDEEKAKENLDNAKWTTNFERVQWQGMVDDQKLIREGKGPSLPSGSTNAQMVSQTLVPMGVISSAQGTGAEEKEVYYRTVGMLDLAIQKEQERRDQKLSNIERRQVLAQVLERSAYHDRDVWFFDSDYDEHQRKPIAMMTAEEMEKAFLPYDDALKDTTTLGGQDLNLVQFLTKMAQDNGNPKPGREQIERAYMAWKHNIGGNPEATELEVIKRLTD